MALQQLGIHMQKRKIHFNSQFVPYFKSNSKWIKDWNPKSESIKPLEKKKKQQIFVILDYTKMSWI